MKNGLVVSATGQAWAPPDRAVLNLGVAILRPDASAALAATSTQIDQLISALVGSGLPRAALQTNGMSLWAESDRQGAPAGYRARTGLRITTEEVDRVGDALQIGLDAIDEGAEMHGISFSLRDSSAVSAQAREQAFAKAVAKATQLASLAGRGLGPVLAIEESEGPAPDEPRLIARMVADSVPVEAGVTGVTVRLTVRFALVG